MTHILHMQTFIAMVKRTMEAVERDVADAEKIQTSAAPLKSAFKSFTTMVGLPHDVLTPLLTHHTTAAPQEGARGERAGSRSVHSSGHLCYT